jgi:GTPase
MDPARAVALARAGFARFTAWSLRTAVRSLVEANGGQQQLCPPPPSASAPAVPSTRHPPAAQKRPKAKPRTPLDPRPRAGRVALIGRPNVGKSTLLNAALDQPLSIVSPMPQTTRDAILGVVHHKSAEIALLDTPGLHRPRTELGRVMNHAAREAARSADVVVFITDVSPRSPARVDEAAPTRGALKPHLGDLTLLADLGTDAPAVLVINKVDRLADKAALLPLLEAFSKVRSFAAVVPISARKSSGVIRVLDEVEKLCPEGPWRYGPDDITDRSARFFAAEYVREQILRATQAEVPHAVAVSIDHFVEPPPSVSGAPGTVHIDATIWVERPGQKRILIGVGGEMLKGIGTRARLRIEALVDRKVNLKLWVRVAPDWRESQRQLEELGYRRAGATDPGHGEALVEAELSETKTEEQQ